jgi:hypothetical protein
VIRRVGRKKHEVLENIGEGKGWEKELTKMFELYGYKMGLNKLTNANKLEMVDTLVSLLIE